MAISANFFIKMRIFRVFYMPRLEIKRNAKKIDEKSIKLSTTAAMRAANAGVCRFFKTS
jgi:hypothetical protein